MSAPAANTTRSARARDEQPRSAVAERLLNGSLKRSYDPVVDLDWDAPLDDDKYFLPPALITVYGTDLWERMSVDERIELSRQEMSNILSTGIWFENLLNRALLQNLMKHDPSSPETIYSLTEMGDECRHMVMFGKAIERCGARPYQMVLWQRLLMHTLAYPMRGTILWMAALIGEEIFDALQRRMLDDPELQPLMSRLMAVHVTEEARHIGFARDGVRRRRPIRGRWETFLAANLHGLAGPLFQRVFTNPRMYANAGLDPVRTAEIARANPCFREQQVIGFASLAAFLEENGLMTRFSRWGWRRGGFLA
ncbi:AurF N-oxygenase family protein [Williamsia sterculiae]|uniref:p-aminobenzoate N-oxygenase AurF n=1 Tax=Williamsia sterculiae TaxID=1344003 RepID=A0A1N7H960_9NOCA|nr:diiron oxygenase [Williamsia sterculiae]SIS21352.1 P-aminobenzoate N-oxygenase AurF [Williamsia sterculiae]